MDIWEGKWRVFFNFFKDNQRITFGFPKSNSNVNDVYFKIDNIEQPRISIPEAASYLSQGMKELIAPRVKGLIVNSTSQRLVSSNFSSYNSANSRYGHCNNCGKVLRGNKGKELCYSCWKDQNH